MSEDRDYARTFKQPQPGTRAAGPDTGVCPRCWSELVDGLCWRHDVGCSRCGGELDLDFACGVCGVVTFPTVRANQ